MSLESLLPLQAYFNNMSSAPAIGRAMGMMRQDRQRAEDIARQQTLLEAQQYFQSNENALNRQNDIDRVNATQDGYFKRIEEAEKAKERQNESKRKLMEPELAALRDSMFALQSESETLLAGEEKRMEEIALSRAIRDTKLTKAQIDAIRKGGAGALDAATSELFQTTLSEARAELLKDPTSFMSPSVLKKLHSNDKEMGSRRGLYDDQVRNFASLGGGMSVLFKQRPNDLLGPPQGAAQKLTVLPPDAPQALAGNASSQAATPQSNLDTQGLFKEYIAPALSGANDLTSMAMRPLGVGMNNLMANMFGGNYIMNDASAYSKEEKEILKLMVTTPRAVPPQTSSPMRNQMFVDDPSKLIKNFGNRFMALPNGKVVPRLPETTWGAMSQSLSSAPWNVSKDPTVESAENAEIQQALQILKNRGMIPSGALELNRRNANPYIDDNPVSQGINPLGFYPPPLR